MEGVMKEMVLSIDPDGKVSHILKDSFFDTRFLGNRKIERLTTIEFDTRTQKFYIHWLKGPYAGQTHTTYQQTIIEGIVPDADEWSIEDGEIFLFDTYEAAVQREIELVNLLRLQGESFE
jgi:hypothetical protein